MAELKQNQRKMTTAKKKSIDAKRYEMTGDVHMGCKLLADFERIHLQEQQ